MIYLLLAIGMILTALTGKAVWKEWREGLHHISEAPKTTQSDESSACLEYLQSIEAKLELLAESVKDIKENLGQDLSEAGTQGADFARIWQEAGAAPEVSPPLTINEQIYQAYRQGKGITELAQEFGKGKGEIELILNLRR